MVDEKKFFTEELRVSNVGRMTELESCRFVTLHEKRTITHPCTSSYRRWTLKSGESTVRNLVTKEQADNT